HRPGHPGDYSDPGGLVAAAGTGGHRQRAAQRLDALAHAQQAEAEAAAAGRRQAASIVDDAGNNVVSRVIRSDRDGNAACLAVADGIAQAFLHDTIERRVDELAEPAAARIDPHAHLEGGIGIAMAPEIDQALDRLLQPELGQPDRAEAAE